MQYLVLKSLHIVSVVLFLGNIVTGAFWKYHADRSGTLAARAVALSGIIASDRLFTLPGVFGIIITGVLIAMTLHLPIGGTRFVLWGLILFGISGVMFALFVAPLQKRLLANVRAGLDGNWNEAQYRKLSSAWNLWGTAATLLPVAVIFIMVMKPA